MCMWKYLHVCECRNAEKSRLQSRTTRIFCFSLSIFVQCAMTFSVLMSEDNEQKKLQPTFPQQGVMATGTLKLEDQIL